MKLKNNKSGFTLLEIIIVIIIVGVMASLALPRFFSTVEYSRSTEALSSISAIRKSISKCGDTTNVLTGCDSFDKLDLDNPGTQPGSHFTYGITIDDADLRNFTILATRNTYEGGNDADTVKMVVITDLASGGGAGASSITRTGTGAFLAMK